MKKTIALPRKHGLRARLQGLPARAPQTQMTFESLSQSYLWVMDRDADARRRSRLIKH